MIALLLAAAASQTAPQAAVDTAVEAERAFAAMAARDGQWTAFRAFVAPEATLFLPQPGNAPEFLAPLKDPARSVRWQPAESYVSCDGTTAANTGPTRWPDGRVGYFATVWSRATGAWKWTLDHGDHTARPRWRWDARPKVRRASCRGTPPSAPETAADMAIAGIVAEALDGKATARTGRTGSGSSPDGTLYWSWTVAPDGARRVFVALWNGRALETVIDDRVAADAA